MKLIYAFVFFISLSSGAWAQKKIGPRFNRTSASQLLPPKLSVPFQTGFAPATGCDTINFPIPDDWNYTIYTSVDNANNVTGFVTGSSVYNFLEKAAYFDASGLDGNYINKVWIGFAVANSSLPANLSKTVAVHIYDGTTGEPGDSLGTITKTLSEIKDDVDAGDYTEIDFPTSITLPDSKKFFVSVDLSNLTWSDDPAIGKDSLAIYASDPNSFLPDPEDNGFGWENYQGSWATFGDDWGADFSLVIHPFVCTDAVFPIRLLSFNGSRQGDKNVITWSTASESGNAGFTLQYSSDGTNFINIVTVGSKGRDGNSSTPLSYSYADSKHIFGSNFYRLKQTDISGKENYSPVINISTPASRHIQIVNTWPSPATDYINLLISAPSNDKLQLSILDVSGKVINRTMQQVSAGTNSVVLNTSSLARGIYFIRVESTNSPAITQKFAKE